MGKLHPEMYADRIGKRLSNYPTIQLPYTTSISLSTNYLPQSHQNQRSAPANTQQSKYQTLKHQEAFSTV